MDLKLLPLYVPLLGSLFLLSESADVHVTYNEVKKLNASCTPFDTCSEGTFKDSLAVRSCECGLHCIKYQTCCIDSEHREQQYGSGGRRNAKRTECLVVHGNKEFFMIPKCSRRWRGNRRVKRACETKSTSFKDPLALAPASSLKTEKLYKNYFCAVCNNDAENLAIWQIKVDKIETVNDPDLPQDVDQDVALEGITYNESTDEWGFLRGRDDKKFEPVIISFVAPKELEAINRICIPDLVSDCPDSWTDETVIKKCQLYMGAVYAMSRDNKRTGYRNIHCAICNYATYTAADVCRYLTPIIRNRPTMSFTLLLDVNSADGNLVGRSDRCKKGESYDPFFKKCRTLVCALPGFTMVGDRCVKS